MRRHDFNRASINTLIMATASKKASSQSVKGAAKKAAPQKKAAVKKAAPARKASPNKATPQKATAAKKAAPQKAAAKAAPAKKAAPKKAAAKATPVKKASPQKVAPNKAMPQKGASKALPVKKATAHKAMPQKASANKAPAKKAPQKAKAPYNDESALMELFVDELKDIYWAEKALVKALPKMQKAATSDKLKTAIANHLEETKGQVGRLEEVFGLLGHKAQAKKCDAMDGLLKEADSIVEDTEKGSNTRDVGVILACQKVEHYEIATYGVLAQLAKTMKLTDVKNLLGQTLDEEKNADITLTGIAEGDTNEAAANEDEEGKEMMDEKAMNKNADGSTKDSSEMGNDDKSNDDNDDTEDDDTKTGKEN